MNRGVQLAACAAALALLGAAPPARSGRERPEGGCDFQGTVQSIDLASHQIVVKSGRKDHYRRHVIRYDANTAIVRTRRPIKPTDIRPAMRIWVYLDEGRPGGAAPVASRLTIADPYPDIYGTVEAVDAKRGVLIVTRVYPGSGPGARRQRLTVRVTRETQIRMKRENVQLDALRPGLRVAVTSVRDAANRTTETARRISAWDPAPAGEGVDARADEPTDEPPADGGRDRPDEAGAEKPGEP